MTLDAPSGNNPTFLLADLLCLFVTYEMGPAIDLPTVLGGLLRGFRTKRCASRFYLVLGFSSTVVFVVVVVVSFFFLLDKRKEIKLNVQKTVQ